MTLLLVFLQFGAIAVLLRALHRQRADHLCLQIRYHLAQAEVAHLRAHLRGIADVVDRCAGGLDKRIAEHAEIRHAIDVGAPALADHEPGLRHWLDASLQFYRELRGAIEGPPRTLS